MFSVVPENEWRLSKQIDCERRETLLHTTFEEISDKIFNQLEKSKIKREKLHDVQGAERIYIEIILPCQLVDLFHNGAGGYRAQYLYDLNQGEKANQFIISKLSEKFGNGDKFTKLSLQHFDSKIWVQENAWLGDNEYSNRNLFVEFWNKNSKEITLAHRFEPSWAQLTPYDESCLEIKGGSVDSNLQPIDKSLKPSRSLEIHRFDYT